MDAADTPEVKMTAESVTAALKEPKIYKVGTLSYDQRQLVMLFFWLMWNDFSITLMEKIGSLTSVLMLNTGATYTQLAILGTVGGVINPWINPLVSTWSDRLRSKRGRRRPFLLAATPPFAFFLMAIPFAPDFYHFIVRYHFVAAILAHSPVNGQALIMSVFGTLSGIFNAVVLAIFQYLYWDVVPLSLMGRFNSLTKNVGILAGLVWAFFILGIADHHVKAVYVGTGAFCLLIYMVSVWRIKEGEYPPPDPHKKGGAIAPIRAYLVESFSDSYYIWIFVASLLYQVGNQGGGYQGYYIYYGLKLTWAIQGWVGGWSQAVATVFGLCCGFYLGAVTDRFKPVRLMAPAVALFAATRLIWFFFVHDKTTYLISGCVDGVVMFAMGLPLGALPVQIFPREKMGQFCSAQAVFYQAMMIFVGPTVAVIFDWGNRHQDQPHFFLNPLLLRLFHSVQFNRLGYVWSAFFYFLSALVYIKVYHNWKRRHGHVPVPHAG